MSPTFIICCHSLGAGAWGGMLDTQNFNQAGLSFLVSAFDVKLSKKVTALERRNDALQGRPHLVFYFQALR